MASEAEKQPSKTPIITVCKEKPDLRKKEPPLVSVQVSNPITYLKSWWKRVIGSEGIDFRLKIHPLTAIAIAVVVATLGFGLGRFALSIQKPFIKFVPSASPSPSPAPTSNPWRETAFSGLLKSSSLNNKFYLLTSSSEAINLIVPEKVDLSGLSGRRILATGRYNEKTRVLEVFETEDLEILPINPEPVPVVSPLPSKEPEVSDTSSPSADLYNENNFMLE